MENTNHSQPKALVIRFSELHRDPRVLREIEWLRDEYEIITVGFTPCGVEGIRHIAYASVASASLTGKIKRAVKSFADDFEKIYWSSDKIATAEKLHNEIFRDHESACLSRSAAFADKL